MTYRRQFASLIVMIAVFAAFNGQAASQGTIVNSGTMLCLDADHFDYLYGNGARIQQWGCSGES